MDLSQLKVNFFGHVKTESGLGTVTRGYIKALKSLGVQVNPIQLPINLRQNADIYECREFDDTADLNLMNVDPSGTRFFVEYFGEHVFKHKKNIGIWFWELMCMHPDFYDYIKYYDEIWVASHFCKRAISTITKKAIHVIPPVIEETKEEKQYDHAHFGLNPENFYFGYLFDASSYIERKNPFALVETFLRVFKDDPKTHLILKVSNLKANSPHFQFFKDLESVSNIQVISGYLDSDEILSLLKCLDCYVSPHRSEGFGLTLTEAMLKGTPVIATNYASTTEFVTAKTGHPVNYHLTLIKDDLGPYMKNALWAEIDQAQLGELMLKVRQGGGQVEDKIIEAKKFIDQRFSVQNVSQAMLDPLKGICL